MADYDPCAGDVWEHVDGGSFYVLARKSLSPTAAVLVQRRPFGDSQAAPVWIRWTTFCTKVACGQANKSCQLPSTAREVQP